MSQGVFGKASVIDLYGQPAALASPPSNIARLYYDSLLNQITVLGASGNVPVAASSMPIASSGSGGFFANGLQTVAGNQTAQAFVGTNNDVRVVMFVLSSAITLSKATFVVTTGISNSKVAAGIYSSDGNTKFVDSGAVSSGSSATTPTGTFTAVTLPPGTYFYAWTCTSTSVTTNAHNQLNNGALATIFNLNKTRIGVAANASSNGVLPTTLGTITAGAFNVASIFFE